MRRLIDIFQNKEASSSQPSGSLANPGDKLEARITDTNRRVIKVHRNNGADKYSATQYPSGTIVETKTTKRR